MDTIHFDIAFKVLTGNAPFPWQQALYERFVSDRVDNIPASCNLPTGLGKTSVVAVWLIALANHIDKLPRRLVYVVNRRTVVDQTTNEVEKLRENLPQLNTTLGPLAISTLRGQFADNREWSADPSRPAVICGTVDMIGSRLLFSGYSVGFKGKPLHAGFLGQDVLLVHDEAHLEPAFQELLISIKQEQARCKEFGKFHVMELSATSRGKEEPFTLTPDDKANPEVGRRIGAKKRIHLHRNKDEKKLAEEIADLALQHKDSGRAVLIFVRKVDDVDRVVKKLPKGSVEKLTGTLRGLERDGLVKKPIFQRFLPESNRHKDVTPAVGTVYLVCTSAGEVGVNISADDLVCDLSTFESMAQRFGRVNRFGLRDDTRIDIVYPNEFEAGNEYDSRRQNTLTLLQELDGDGSPNALGELNLETRLAAFAPPPITLPVSDILFDSWALTSVRGKLPGRPPVEPYLHGISEWEPPQTMVAWRDEVWELRREFEDDRERKRFQKYAAELLEDYPLKPHELLRDSSGRVFDRLKKLNVPAETQVWVIADDELVSVTTLGDLIQGDKEELNYKTVLLPPSAGGLENGMLASDSATANDVADEWYEDKELKRRVRIWDDDAPPDRMRLIRTVDTRPDADDTDDEESGGRRLWHWYESIRAGDSDGSKSNRKPVLWAVHTHDVVRRATEIVERLPLPPELRQAVVLAAKFHDLGKKRRLFQRILGNLRSDVLLSKSGKKAGRIPEQYRHEFGSLLDAVREGEFQQLNSDMNDLVLHLIAVHHGRGRPHFPPDEVFDPEPQGQDVSAIAAQQPRRFAALQRKYGRWGLAYLESLLRAADYHASANPSEFVEDMS